MDYDLSPPGTLFNMVMALNLGMLSIPPIHRTAEMGNAILMVNNRATYQRQSYIHDAPTGMQVVSIPTTNNKIHLVPAIVEDHKLYFNPHIISFMLIHDPQIYDTQDVCQPDNWDVCQADQPNAHDINQCMHDDLQVPITDVDDASIKFCATHWACTPLYSNWGDFLKRPEYLRI